jgi:hypothetical protein
MKNKLLLLLPFTLLPFFISSQQPITSQLSHLKQRKAEALEAIKSMQGAMPTLEDPAEQKLLSVSTKVWEDLYKALDPSDKKLTSLVNIIFNDLCKKSTPLNTDHISHCLTLNVNNCTYATIFDILGNQPEKYDKKTINKIYKCFQDIPFFASRIKSIPQLKTIFRGEAWFFIIGSGMYMKKILSKLLLLLDNKISELNHKL